MIDYKKIMSVKDKVSTDLSSDYTPEQMTERLLAYQASLLEDIRFLLGDVLQHLRRDL